MARKACKKEKCNKKDPDKVKVKYTCSRCGLKAAREKHLCKPGKI